MKIKNLLIVQRYHIILFFLIIFIFSPGKIFEEKISFPAGKIKFVALTFDDGPHPYYTREIVKILNKYGVRATFFFVGKQVEKYPELVKFVSENSNCKIGNHTYFHKDLTKLSPIEIYDELYNTQELLYKLVDKDDAIIPYFRPPGGKYNHSVEKIARILNLRQVLWTVFTNDHINNSKIELIKKIDTLCTGDREIILLHSGRDATLHALEDIMALLISKGYHFVTVDEINFYGQNFSN